VPQAGSCAPPPRHQPRACSLACATRSLFLHFERPSRRAAPRGWRAFPLGRGVDIMEYEGEICPSHNSPQKKKKILRCLFAVSSLVGRALGATSPARCSDARRDPTHPLASCSPLVNLLAGGVGQPDAPSSAWHGALPRCPRGGSAQLPRCCPRGQAECARRWPLAAYRGLGVPHRRRDHAEERGEERDGVLVGGAAPLLARGARARRKECGRCRLAPPRR
jgi:hypothetical protein